MKKKDKEDLVLTLKEQMEEYGNFYITDIGDLEVAKINVVRRKCFDHGIKMRVAKNTLIKKAMEAAGGDFSGLYDLLKGTSCIMFSKSANAPAKLIKELRKKEAKPKIKGAYIDSAIFIGDNQLDTLVNLKSKEELIADIIGLLQSPVKNVVSGLRSGERILGGVVKTLQSRAG